MENQFQQEQIAYLKKKNTMLIKLQSNGNVSFPHEAIRGLDFFLAQVDAFPYSASDREAHVLRKSLNPRIASFGRGIL